jgi:hypothetical protein
MPRLRWLAPLGAAAALAAFALWPASDPGLAIRFDPDAVRAAGAFLERADARPRAGLPNVVLIVADDLGKHDVSVYPPASLPTPQLERPAAGRGARRHVVSPVCFPRAGLHRALSAAP